MVGAAGSESSPVWTPLRVRAFRILWIAQLFSLVGTWMQTVGAQWLLVDEPNAATLVGLVQAALLAPTLMLALPAGALADLLDRRRLLVGVQAFQVLVGAGMAALAALDRLPPVLLLAGTFLLGVGATLTVPAYRSLVQDLVGREQVRSASALNAVAANLARAVGPAVAGLLVAQVGVAAVFALNAATYVALAAALLVVRPPAGEGQALPERFGSAVLAGTRFVRHSPVLRRMLLRILLFVVPGAALWALLPLVAARLLGLDAFGYGVLLGALGVGAVAGALMLPYLLTRLSITRLVLVAGLAFGAATAVCALAPHPGVAMVVLVPAGLAWLGMLVTINGTVQAFLPAWVRARGLSIYQMVFAGGQAVGALAWGVAAQWLGLAPTLLTAAVLLAAGAVTVVRWPLRDVSGLDRNPAVYWPEPQVELAPDLDDGPVLVTVTYTVAPADAAGFLEAMAPVRRMKLRTGATSWALYRDAADPSRFVEVSQYPNWAEHLRQHGGRLTGRDQALEAVARDLTAGVPQVQHLLPARAAAVDRPG